MPDARPLSPTNVDPHAETAASGPGPSKPPAADDPLLGRSLRHFRVDAPLGQGGMGAVYRAWDTSLDRPVALKVLHRSSPETRARFLREARAQANLRHPNVVPIHFVGEDDDVAFLVMDLVEGESLSALLHREGRLPTNRAIDIADAVAAALEAGVESGLVHRDVKPSNILLDRRGHVLLADFGLAKHVAAPDDAGTGEPSRASAADTLTHAGAIVGTPAYAAPEQGAGAAVDHRADVYALGVTLYESLTGQTPFSAPSLPLLLEQHRSEAPMPLRTLAPDLAPAVEAVVLKALAKRPADRYATYGEMRAALAAARVKERVSAPAFARALALFVDLVVFAIPGALASSVYDWLGWPVIAVLFAIVEGRFATTAGKRLLHLETLGPDGRPGWRRALVRSVVKVWGPIVATPLASLLPPGPYWQIPVAVVVVVWLAGFFAVLVGKRRAWHDRLAQTTVVYRIEG